MYSNFLTAIGSKLTERWVANLFAPAFVFWLGGLVAYLQDSGWSALETTFDGLDETLQIGLLLGGLLLVLASGFVMQRFDLAVLRIFEGYWPRWTSPLRDRLLARQRRWFDKTEDRWNTLMVKKTDHPDQFTPQDLEVQIDLDMQLHQFPAQRSRQMPSKLGNILRAAETRPRDKYGLDAVVCWPRLWMVLPEGVKTEIQQARSDLNTAARIWLWSLLFLSWFLIYPRSWWVLPLSCGTMWFAHHWMLTAASTYGTLLEAAFDLHRFALYEALHWPLPKTPEEEHHSGALLTQYLWRGSRQASPAFVSPEES
ncbi:MAG: hypothetical protein WBA10_06080 [Elainellaceae cyanobacterium]